MSTADIQNLVDIMDAERVMIGERVKVLQDLAKEKAVLMTKLNELHCMVDDLEQAYKNLTDSISYLERQMP